MEKETKVTFRSSTRCVFYSSNILGNVPVDKTHNDGGFSRFFTQVDWNFRISLYSN